MLLHYVVKKHNLFGYCADNISFVFSSVCAKLIRAWKHPNCERCTKEEKTSSHDDGTSEGRFYFIVNIYTWWYSPRSMEHTLHVGIPCEVFCLLQRVQMVKVAFIQAPRRAWLSIYWFADIWNTSLPSQLCLGNSGYKDQTDGSCFRGRSQWNLALDKANWAKHDVRSEQRNNSIFSSKITLKVSTSHWLSLYIL